MVDIYRHLSEESVVFVVRVEERRYFSTLKMETRGSIETLVYIYLDKRRQTKNAILSTDLRELSAIIQPPMTNLSLFEFTVRRKPVLMAGWAYCESFSIANLLRYCNVITVETCKGNANSKLSAKCIAELMKCKKSNQGLYWCNLVDQNSICIFQRSPDSVNQIVSIKMTRFD